MKRDENYYPEGAMQAIPDATIKALEKNDGKIFLGSEVERILVKDGRAFGVKCVDGSENYSDIVISNAPIHHTQYFLWYPQNQKDRRTIPLLPLPPCPMNIRITGKPRTQRPEGRNIGS